MRNAWRNTRVFLVAALISFIANCRGKRAEVPSGETGGAGEVPYREAAGTASMAVDTASITVDKDSMTVDTGLTRARPSKP
jgi:hypothetical protein